MVSGVLWGCEGLGVSEVIDRSFQRLQEDILAIKTGWAIKIAQPINHSSQYAGGFSWFGGCVSGHSDGAGASDVFDTVRAAEVYEGLDFFLGATDLDHHEFLADIDDLTIEHFDEGVYLCAFFGRRGYGNEHQVPCDDGLADIILDFDDGDNFGELLSYLLDDAVVTEYDDGHTAEVRLFCATDDERIDIESPRGEHSCDVRQNTGFIFD
jgi:hypothetical protein